MSEYNADFSPVEEMKRISEQIEKSQQLYPNSVARQEQIRINHQSTICTLLSDLFQIASTRDKHEVRSHSKIKNYNILFLCTSYES